MKLNFKLTLKWKCRPYLHHTWFDLGLSNITLVETLIAGQNDPEDVDLWRASFEYSWPTGSWTTLTATLRYGNVLGSLESRERFNTKKKSARGISEQHVASNPSLYCSFICIEQLN